MLLDGSHAMVNSRRIPWFLALQRILQFPRHFTAPPAIPLRARRPVADYLDGGLGRAPVLPQAWGTTLHASRLPSLPYPARNGMMHPSIVPAAIKFLQPGSLRASQPGRRAPQWKVEPAPAGTRGRDRVFQMSAMPAGKPYQMSVAVQRHLRTVRDAQVFQAGLRAPPPVVTNRPVLVRQSVTESEFSLPPGPAAQDTAATAYWMGSPPHGERATAGEGLADLYQLASLERDTYDGDDRSQRDRQRISTLHIDGSALGRWAIQHLERALGKPATGMTGVDPRATLPRGRVSPF